MQNSKIKVLGFDSWTMGASHYIRLIEAFDSNNFELLLVHLGSWGNEPNSIKEETIQGLKVRDISFYKTKDFDKILKIENPDVVLFLSTGSFAHRAMLRYCNKFSIPTINLAHGIMSVGHYKGENAPVKVSIIAHISFVLSRTKITVFHVLPIYFMSLWKTKASIKEWIRFLTDLKDRIFYKEQFKYALDAKPTVACVFVNAEVDDAMTRYSLTENEVEVVGNPDLMKFQIDYSMIENQLSIDRSSYTDIIYIECGMTFFGVYFKSTDEYCEHIGKISTALNDFGFRLLFKIKPQTPEYVERLTKGLLKNGVNIVDNDTFQQNLLNARACITEPSTLGILPELLGLPVFVNKMDQLDTLLYGDIFMNYPAVVDFNDIQNFKVELLNIEQKCNKEFLKKWIFDNSGPLPAAEMPYRIVDVIKRIVK